MPRRLATLATCNLNQFALDFEGNLARVIESIVQAKRRHAKYRVGPELEIPGYGCEDHFTEQDTTDHSWECITELIRGGHTDGIVVDVGTPCMHRGVRYNCRVFLLDHQVLFIRPKCYLADDGNYRESRYFTAWKHAGEVQQHRLPRELTALTGQTTAPIGDAILSFNDAVLGVETCEELFTPLSPHIHLCLSGCEIISNGSGSHHQLRKLDTRMDLITSATSKCGGVYLYANAKGCDGGRLYYDGCASIAVNGMWVAQAAQFSLEDVEVAVASVDLDEVVSYRGAVASLQVQASEARRIHTVEVDFAMCSGFADPLTVPSPTVGMAVHAVEEEIAYGPACWLWDYLRRSGASGFLLPLSGGADSAATAAIVGCMCQMVVAAVKDGNAQVEEDALRLGQYAPGSTISEAAELAGRIFCTVYMGTNNSSAETRERAKTLSSQIGSYHMDVRIDSVVTALTLLFATITGKTPRFKADGGTQAENLALQNIQARIRMVLSFMLAQLTPWVRGRSGFMLVLGSANVDENLRGYLTKYDCSSADLNPIGGVAKADLKRFLAWGATHLRYPVLASVVAAPPTAELEPLREGVPPQTDEEDMGMTYLELGLFGRLRKVARCGPVSMFLQLLYKWQEVYSPAQIADKVKFFFKNYSLNRHKATTITPSYHAESYSPDDNRYDLRQFLYNVRWPWQFRRIDEILAQMTSGEKQA